MKFNELPIEVQDRLKSELAEKANKCTNTAFEIRIYSKTGKFWLWARRHVGSCVNKNGNPWILGGSHAWTVRFGDVGFRSYKNPLGQTDWMLDETVTYTGHELSTGEVIKIPKEVSTKKEVLALIASLPMFDYTLLNNKK